MKLVSFTRFRKLWFSSSFSWRFLRQWLCTITYLIIQNFNQNTIFCVQHYFICFKKVFILVLSLAVETMQMAVVPYQTFQLQSADNWMKALSVENYWLMACLGEVISEDHSGQFSDSVFRLRWQYIYNPVTNVNSFWWLLAFSVCKVRLLPLSFVDLLL